MESGQYERSTGHLPQWYLDEPQTVRGDEFYMQGFWELSSCRQFGGAIGPIPWDRTVEYGRFYNLEPDMLKTFVSVIRDLDEEYLSFQRNEQKNRTQK